MGYLISLIAIWGLFAMTAADPAREKERDEESVEVTIVGTIRAGIVAIGGETTGTTITAKKMTFELDFGEVEDSRMLAEELDGKKAKVRGSLERRAGVEIKERWIVTVEKIEPVD